MHFRILKVIATSGFLRALECTKFVFGRDSAPDPAGGAYSTPQTVRCFKEAILLRGRGGESRRKVKEKGKGGQGKGGRGREGRGRPLTQVPG